MNVKCKVERQGTEYVFSQAC